MRRPALWLVLLAVAGCSFDAAGLGSHANDDASVSGTADAPANLPDAPQGTPDAPIVSTPDAPPPPPDAVVIGVACGAMTCTNGDVCCVPRQGSGGGSNPPQCKSQCDNGDSTFACDGPEDCSGKECCISQTGSSCADSCGWGQSQACHQDADCGGIDSCCPVQGTAVSVCQTVCF